MISPTTDKILYDKNGLQIRSGNSDVVKINSKIDKKVEGMIKILILNLLMDNVSINNLANFLLFLS